MIKQYIGRLAQSGRALPLQGRSHRFKSCSAHKGFSEIYPTKIQKIAQKPHIYVNFCKILI